MIKEVRNIVYFKHIINFSLVYEINEDVADYLKTLSGPLGIISVAGMYRTGKSYLLNRMLLNRSGGFGVGPTINPCTKVRFNLINLNKLLMMLKIGNVGMG